MGGRKTAVCHEARTIREAVLYAREHFDIGNSEIPPQILPITCTSLARVNCVADIDKQLFDEQRGHHDDPDGADSWCGLYAANNLRPSARTSPSND